MHNIVAAIAALLYAFVWPQMKKQMVARSCAAEYVENTDAYNQCVNEGMAASSDAGR